MDTLHILEDRAHNPTNQPDAPVPRYSIILFDFICECDEILKLYIQYTILLPGMKKFLSEETRLELTINKIK